MSPAPLAPTPLPRGAPAPRPPPPRSAQLGAGALLHRCLRAAARQGRGGPLRPAPQAHYRPRRSRFARHRLRRPRCLLSPCAKRGTRGVPAPGPVAWLPGLQGVWAGWQAAGGGRLCTPAPRQQRPEPTRLRLTIGSGCSALPLIGAGASWPRPAAAWEMESTPGPHPRHAGSWRRSVHQSTRPPWSVRSDPGERLPVGLLPALKREAAMLRYTLALTTRVLL